MARDLAQEARNKALALEAFDALFNRRDFEAAESYRSPDYVQHSAGIDSAAQYEHGLIRARTLAALAAKRLRRERVGAVPCGVALDTAARR
jgi:hypothetical protein